MAQQHDYIAMQIIYKQALSKTSAVNINNYNIRIKGSNAETEGNGSASATLILLFKLSDKYIRMHIEELKRRRRRRARSVRICTYTIFIKSTERGKWKQNTHIIEVLRHWNG